MVVVLVVLFVVIFLVGSDDSDGSDDEVSLVKDDSLVNVVGLDDINVTKFVDFRIDVVSFVSLFNVVSVS